MSARSRFRLLWPATLAALAFTLMLGATLLWNFGVRWRGAGHAVKEDAATQAARTALRGPRPRASFPSPVPSNPASETTIEVQKGTLLLYVVDNPPWTRPPDDLLYIHRDVDALRARWHWWPGRRAEGPLSGCTVTSWWLPLWMPAAFCAAPAAILWVREARRRARPGHCPCGYSLAGLIGAVVCPECGRRTRAEPCLS